MAINIIGITGGIGSGKSVVSRVLRCNGHQVYDCDSEAKRMMKHDFKIKDALIEKFGKEIYTENGDINRKLLSSIIFSNDNARNYVNSIVHKAVKEDIEKKIKKAFDSFFVESAILASSGLASICTCIWLIEADLNEKIKRIQIRDKSSEDDALKRIESQRNEENLLKNYNFISVINDNNHPLLPFILKETDNFYNLQTYLLTC